MVMHRFYLLSPISVTHLYKDFRRCLSDSDPGVMDTCLVLLYDLVKVCKDHVLFCIENIICLHFVCTNKLECIQVNSFKCIEIVCTNKLEYIYVTRTTQLSTKT